MRNVIKENVVNTFPHFEMHVYCVPLIDFKLIRRVL